MAGKVIVGAGLPKTSTEYNVGRGKKHITSNVSTLGALVKSSLTGKSERGQNSKPWLRSHQWLVENLRFL